MKNIKTYGEIQYYLYDGDKKEKKVSKKTFLNSKGASVKHYHKIPKKKLTTSLTGKVIEKLNHVLTFEKYSDIDYNKKGTFGIDSHQGPNMRINNNPNQPTFDGGDGPSGTSVPDTTKSVVKSVKNKRGNNAKVMQKKRKEKIKKYSDDEKDAKMMTYQTSDDLTKYAPNRKPTTNAGGSSQWG